MKYDLSVIAPCFNESKNVIELTDRLLKTFDKRGISGEIILVNDASTDNTGGLINDLAKKYPNRLQGLHHKQNKRMFETWKTGLHAARGVYICLIDADLQNLPEDVGRLYKEILFSHVDVVQGWRNHLGRLNDSSTRLLLSKGLNWLLNKMFGMRLRDNKCAFVVCRKEVLEDILIYTYKYHYPQTFIGVSAKAKGYSIREVETIFQDRKLGRSFLSDFPISASIFTFLDIVKGFFEFRMFLRPDITLHIFAQNNTSTKKDPPLPFWRRIYFKLYVLLFPFHHWKISYGSFGYYNDLKKTQWLSPNKIKEYQELRLRQLVNHAYYHVPFYRELFDQHSIKPEDIKAIEDLMRLPTIDKNTIRENLFLGMLSDNHYKKNLHKITTSGSTGEPLVCYSEKKSIEMRWGATQRSLEWTGYRFGDRQVRLWHKYVGLSIVEIIKEMTDAFLSRRKFIPAYEISDANLDQYVDNLMRFKPALLDGYAESFNLLARFLQKKKLAGAAWQGHKPKGIMSSAQTMPPESRKIIEESFGCGVYDKYGSREFTGGIAYQCETRNGYHVVAECNIVEVIKSNGSPAKPGETGMAVITDLNNYAMPLIRYQLGDLIVQRDKNEVCSCGRGLPLIGAIEGRPQATIIGVNNQYLPGSFFARYFGELDGKIKQFQVVQHKFGEIDLKLVKANLYTDVVLDNIIATIKNHLGVGIKINVEFADSIPLGKNGKRHHSLSYLDIGEISRYLN